MNISELRILVTGGAGFIGSNIVEYLLKNGVKFVRVLDNLSTGYQNNIQPFLDSYDNIEFLYGDITDLEMCRKAMNNIDVVCHQAALGSVPRSIDDPLSSHNSNVNGFLNVLLAAKERDIKRVVYASSSSVYGDNLTLPKVEHKTGNVLSPYAATKEICEIYANVFTKCYGMKCIGLRYFNVFGSRQDPNGAYAAVIPKFLNLMRQGVRPVINGDGTYSRDFTYIDNVVYANVLAMTTDNGECFGEAFNIGCGEQYNLNQLVECLNKKLAIKIEPIYGENRNGDIPHSNADISKAINLLGYKVLINFEEGINKLINYSDINIITFGTCRINTTIDYINCPFIKIIDKIICTNTSQIVLFINYYLGNLSTELMTEYKNIISAIPYLKKNINVEKIFNTQNILFLEISTIKKYIYKKNLLLPHDYTRKEIDIKNIIDNNYVSIENETDQEIIDNLLYIKKYFPNLVVITHIKNYSDNLIRDNTINLIINICNKHNIKYISPSNHIDINRILYLKDTEHYTEKGYELMNNIFINKLINHINNKNLFVIVALNYYKYFALYQIYTLLKNNTHCDILLILDNYKEIQEIDNFFINEIYKICNKFNSKIEIIYLPHNYNYNEIILFSKIDNEEIVNNCKKIATPCTIAHFIRYIIPFKYFKNYINIYIGDADILINDNNIFDCHIQHCTKLNINFSNGYRTNLSRLTGLHFFINENYEKSLKYTFNTFEEGINFLLSDEYKNIFLTNYKNKNINLYNDETFLYFNQNDQYIKILENNPNYRPIHGFHIGSVRSGGIYKYNNLKYTTKEQYDIFIKKYNADPILSKIHNICKITKAGQLVDKTIKLINK